MIVKIERMEDGRLRALHLHPAKAERSMGIRKTHKGIMDAMRADAEYKGAKMVDIFYGTEGLKK